MQPASLSGGELGQHRPHLLCAVNWKPSCEPYAGQASSFAASPGRMSTACSGPPTATPPPSRRTRGLAGLDGFGRGQERVGRSVSASDGVRIGCCEAGSGRPSRHLENPARTIPGCVRKGSGESAVDRLGGASAGAIRCVGCGSRRHVGSGRSFSASPTLWSHFGLETPAQTTLSWVQGSTAAASPRPWSDPAKDGSFGWSSTLSGAPVALLDRAAREPAVRTVRAGRPGDDARGTR